MHCGRVSRKFADVVWVYFSVVHRFDHGDGFHGCIFERLHLQTGHRTRQLHDWPEFVDLDWVYLGFVYFINLGMWIDGIAAAESDLAALQPQKVFLGNRSLAAATARFLVWAPKMVKLKWRILALPLEGRF